MLQNLLNKFVGVDAVVMVIVEIVSFVMANTNQITKLKVSLLVKT